MIAVDMTIVSVAMPSIKRDLGLTEGSLVWLINAYTLAYGSTLLIGGRMGDLFGYRRQFLLGIAVFTLASLCAGLANWAPILLCARVVQGVGGALLTSVTFALILNLFSDVSERVKAISIDAIFSAAGASAAALLGGILTSALSWRWVFLINIPIGAAVFVLAMTRFELPDRPSSHRVHLDVRGALIGTASLLLLLLAASDTSSSGLPIIVRLVEIAGAIFGTVLFVRVEARQHCPVLPLSLFRSRRFTVACIVGMLWAAALYDWFFSTTLYFQLVLGYSPIQVGLAFVPANLVTGVLSVWVVPRLIRRYGLELPVVVGSLAAAAGLLSMALIDPSRGTTYPVIAGMLLLGVSAGIASSPLLLVALRGVSPNDSGVASGTVNTALLVGGMLGLALIASLAPDHTQLSGDHLAFLVGAALAGAAALLAATFLPTERRRAVYDCKREDAEY